MSWTFIQLSRQKEHVTPMEATSGKMCIRDRQRVFPGYYYTKLIQDLTEKQTIDATQLALFVAVFGLNLLFFYLLVPKGKMRN